MSEGGNPLFRKPCLFVAGAATLDSLPPISHPELAFIGRSNVGKSSLINALLGQKSLARTSQNPGATQQLNFYSLDERLMLVDMPGYGFARVSKTKKTGWDSLIRSYLCGRPSLKRTFVLIDARRGVMQADEDFMDMLDEAAVNFQIVLTKIDHMPDAVLGMLFSSIKEVIARHAAAHPQILATSSLTKHGIQDLQEAIIPFVSTL